MSNSSFDDKKALYQQSHIEITKQLCSQVRWTGNEIKQRGLELAHKAIEIWPYFGEVGDEDAPTFDTHPDADPAMTPEEALQHLGDGDRIKSQFFKLSNGTKVLITNSKFHAKKRYYWYGITPANLKTIEELGISHVAFGMGTKAIALVPIDELRVFIAGTNSTKNADKSVRHYHVVISYNPEPEMRYSDSAPKVRLARYIVPCEKVT